jgi:transketolase
MLDTILEFSAKREGRFLIKDLAKIVSDAETLAREARVEILKMTSYAKASHVGSALSVIDILCTFYSGVANISINNAHAPDRDILILSKGHAASALYATLSIQGFFPKKLLDNYCDNGAKLGGHVTSSDLVGIELSTGSLGHGLPYGLGIALSRKMTGVNGKVFVVMSDGECDEGTTWESALLANHHELDNLVVIIDRNRIQSLKDTERTLKLEPFKEKWESFGWTSDEVDGHDYAALALAANRQCKGPKVIIANTTKGRGVSFMENSVLWHYRSPNSEELRSAIEEVQSTK